MLGELGGARDLDDGDFLIQAPPIEGPVMRRDLVERGQSGRGPILPVHTHAVDDEKKAHSSSAALWTRLDVSTPEMAQSNGPALSGVLATEPQMICEAQLELCRY